MTRVFFLCGRSLLCHVETNESNDSRFCLVPSNRNQKVCRSFWMKRRALVVLYGGRWKMFRAVIGQIWGWFYLSSRRGKVVCPKHFEVMYGRYLQDPAGWRDMSFIPHRVASWWRVNCKLQAKLRLQITNCKVMTRQSRKCKKQKRFCLFIRWTAAAHCPMLVTANSAKGY